MDEKDENYFEITENMINNNEKVSDKKTRRKKINRRPKKQKETKNKLKIIKSVKKVSVPIKSFEGEKPKEQIKYVLPEEIEPEKENHQEEITTNKLKEIGDNYKTNLNKPRRITRIKKPEWLSFKNPYLFTIFSLGLFVGFWLGFFVFAQVHIIVLCQPSGRTLLDVTRDLRNEFTLSTEVAGCERIDLVISKPKLTEIFSKKGEIITESTAEKGPSQGMKSIPAPGAGESASGTSGAGIPMREDAPEGTRILTLDVFGICSGKTDIGAQYFDNSESCLVKDILPYYVVFDKNDTHIDTSFYEGVGFTESYEMSDYVGVFRLFAKDLSTIDESVKVVKAFGPMADYFELGDYVIEDITTGGKTETVASFPLYVKGDIPKTVDWSYLGFYIYMTQNIYYIGDVWFYVV